MPAVRYVTPEDVDAFTSRPVRLAAFLDSETGEFSTDEFNRAAELASKMAQSAALRAGYAAGADTDGSTSSDFVRAMTLAYLVRMTYGRQQQEIPADTKAMLEEFIASTVDGRAPDPDQQPGTLSGIGGNKFASPTTRTTSDRSVFGRLKDFM